MKPRTARLPPPSCPGPCRMVRLSPAVCCMVVCEPGSVGGLERRAFGGLPFEQRRAASVGTDELLVEREKNHMLQEEVETTLKDLQSM